jgi:ABC-type Zn2+ transport system substrate-binding protein/surface adhesin
MKNICGIFLITLANLILLAHVMVPHTHCESSTEEPHAYHNHSHDHDHNHDSEEHSGFGHFFCTISHVEEDFSVKQYSDLQLISSISHAVIVYTLFKPFEKNVIDKKVQNFEQDNISIYHSPYLIRSGEKAPPIA